MRYIRRKDNHNIIKGFGYVQPGGLGEFDEAVYEEVEGRPPEGYKIEELITQESQERLRQKAYKEESDPLFFQWQAGENTEAQWLAKREEIRLRYPYPSV